MKHFLFAILLLPFMVSAQGDPAPITQALSRGDASVLTEYFDATLELAVLEEEGMYNKSQAGQLVRRFFAQHKPSSFTEVHQGASRSSDSQYIIGNLVTNNGTFRVYLYLSNQGGQLIIQECRFDRE
jgi:hypothetical protein